MKINYHRLFNLRVTHNYYSDANGRFFHFEPLPETQLLLKSGKMLMKGLPNGFTILYRTNDSGSTPFIDLSGDQKFIFTIVCSNTTQLMGTTSLDESVSKEFKSSNILFFANDPTTASDNPGNPEMITHTIIDSSRTELFTFQFGIEGNPASVLMRVFDSDGNLVSIGEDTEGVPFPTSLPLSIANNNTFLQQVDLRNKPKGRYTISIFDDSGTTILLTEKIYVDDTIATKKILGLVELSYTSATNHLFGNTEEYLLKFERLNTIWKYFIINRTSNIDFTTDSVSINDQGVLNGVPYSINVFSRAYAGISLTADSVGTAGNNITLSYSGTSEHSALILSGKTLEGGTTASAAQGTITIINNTITGYSIQINGTSFTEGVDFNNGTTPADTATAIINVINANAGLNVSATMLNYDTLVQNTPALVFHSESSIPFYEIPKTNIQLRRTSDNQTIVKNLPNPSHIGVRKRITGVPESEIYVYI